MLLVITSGDKGIARTQCLGHVPHQTTEEVAARSCRCALYDKAKCVLGLLSSSDVLRQRHQELRGVFRARHKRHIVSHPDEPPVFSSIALLDLKLRSLTVDQFGHERPVSFVVILESELEKRQTCQFFL